MKLAGCNNLKDGFIKNEYILDLEKLIMTRNYIYDEKNGKTYNFKYLFDNNFDVFTDLVKKTFYDKNEIVINDDTFTCSKELKPVRKTINGIIKENNNSIYRYKNNAFNYLGPGLVKDGKLVNDSINYSFDSSKSYMFVDDISGCYKITLIESNIETR